MQVKQRWRNATLVTPTGEVARDLLIEGDRITGIVERNAATGEDWNSIDARGKILFPGMIDLLQHGYNVHLYNDTEQGCVAHNSQLLLARGVTGFLPSISCVPPETMEGVLNRLSAQTEKATGA
ncbi:MAG: N-acetylglucosamine-6-phosphate deacetylase, partial [Pseudomonadota bacterium]